MLRRLIILMPLLLSPGAAYAEVPLRCGQPITATLDAEATETFEFQARAGEAVAVEAVDVSGTIGALDLRIVGPLGGESEDLVETCSGRAEQQIPTDGTYQIEISVGDCSQGHSGSYTVTLNAITPTLGGQPNCGVPLPCGASTAGTALAVAGEVDSFTLSAHQDGPITLTLATIDASLGRLELRLYDPAGELIEQSFTGALDKKADHAGTYTVLVNAESPTTTGRYTVTWQALSCGCVGDCNSDGEVTVDELVTGINIALGTTRLDECSILDSDGDGTATVDELVTAVNHLLHGCAGH